MKLMLINDSYFSSSFNELGIETFRVGTGDSCDYQITDDHRSLPQIIESSGFRPDAVLIVDSIDSRFFLRDVEKVTIPVAFYAIDSPINEFWQRYYSHGFDRVYVDQYDQWRIWQQSGLNWVRWLPLAADHTLFFPLEKEEKEYQVIFVGTINGDLRPKRSAILYRLRQLTDVKIVDGSGTRKESAGRVAEFYRKGNIILNELLFDGINLRTFEAMATGGVVLTERNRGENRLFEDGVHLVSYDFEDLENVVEQLLSSPEKIREIGENAASLVSKSHTIVHRAAKVINDLSKLALRKEKMSQSSSIEVNWGLWQASWKWPELTAEIRQEAEKSLLGSNGELDAKRKAILSMQLGDHENAASVLEEALEKDPDNPHYKAILACIAMARGNNEKAAKTIGVHFPLKNDDLHLAVGDLLLQAGYDLTPGFNRLNSPITGWTAFEHYHYAYSQNDCNREALRRLTTILEKHKATEFLAPLWQHFHALHPTDHESMEQLRRIAKIGYYIPGERMKFTSRPLSGIRNTSQSIRNPMNSSAVS